MKLAAPFSWQKIISCSGKTWTKEGKDWLLMGWELIHAQKSLTGREKQISTHGQGIGMPPTRISTNNWLTTALWHPSGEKWKAEEGQGDISHFSGAAEVAHPWLFSLAHFFSNFEWAKWSFFHYVSCKIAVQINGVLLGKGCWHTVWPPLYLISPVHLCLLWISWWSLFVNIIYVFYAFQDCCFVPRLYLS